MSASECWAIGAYYTGTTDQTLTERWDGTSWAVVTSPNTSTTQGNVLYRITCAAASECWAVGFYYPDPTPKTLTEHWDGASWTVITSPNAGTLDNGLLGVTCASASNCWAVGYSFNGTLFQTLIERWDGASWAVITSPNATTTQDNVLTGVTCLSPSQCWAVGAFAIGAYGHGVYQTLTEAFTIPVQLISVVSTKVHGSAGTFDVDLPLAGNPGIECRSGGTNGDYTLVLKFANTLISAGGASLASGTGSISNGMIDSSDGHNYIVSLAGVTNAQYVAVSLSNVTDSAGNFSPAVAGQMGVLLGDVNASGRVDAADVSLVRQQTLQPVTSSNFRNDINASGRIDAADVSIARQQTLTSLPPVP
jgi:hypothetical protein